MLRRARRCSGEHGGAQESTEVLIGEHGGAQESTEVLIGELTNLSVKKEEEEPSQKGKKERAITNT